MKRSIAAAALAALLLLGGCGEKENTVDHDTETENVTEKTAADTAAVTEKAAAVYARITQEEAMRRMREDDGHIVLDVRTHEEYAEGHIPGAVCLPNEEIGTEPPTLLSDREQIILVYCRSGRRSKEAAQKLADMGYTNVLEFGGILDWTGETVWEEDVPETPQPVPQLVIWIGDRYLYPSAEDNSSAAALIEKLSAEPVTLTLRDWGGFEKVGTLPWTLPRNDERITTKPGDVILYQGNQITIYYAENTWELTRLAALDSVTEQGLRALLGDGEVTVTFSVEWSE